MFLGQPNGDQIRSTTPTEAKHSAGRHPIGHRVHRRDIRVEIRTVISHSLKSRGVDNEISADIILFFSPEKTYSYEDKPQSKAQAAESARAERLSIEIFVLHDR